MMATICLYWLSDHVDAHAFGVVCADSGSAGGAVERGAAGGAMYSPSSWLQHTMQCVVHAAQSARLL
jgi:hypothetical protein